MSHQPAMQAALKPEVHTVGLLTLSNFRNHQYASLDVAGKSVVLYGHNGAGKTNILEAISLLAPGRGFRRSKLSEMDRICHSAVNETSRAESISCSVHGASQQGERQNWIISAEIYGSIGSAQIGTSRETPPPLGGRLGGGRSLGESLSSKQFSPHPGPLPMVEGVERRIVRVNGESLKSPNQLAEYISILWLTPQMDQLFLEGGTTRRKFLDRLVYGFEPAHATRVNRYETAMRERNKLLAESRAQSDWLTSIEAQMAEYGAAIAFARAQAISHINQVMQMSELDFPKAILGLNGEIERAVEEGGAALDVEKLYKKMLADSRLPDAQAGRTLVGIHRAEFSVTHTQKNVEAAFCSTGEQKALLLSIVLAEARSCSLWHGHVPVLILDEVAAHLDPQKRQELYKEIQALGAQAWMSGVSCDLFEEMHDNTLFFRVEQGKIFAQ